MNKPLIQKITSFLIIGLFLLQLLSPSSLYAAPLNYDNPNKSGNNPYQLSLKGVVSSGLLTSVVGCTGIVDKVAKVTTDFAQKLAVKKAKSKATSAEAKSHQSDSVPVVDSTSIKTEEQGHNDTQTDIEKDSYTENCLKGIAITLAKNQLTAMTKYTMNWITTGFNGDPLYVRDVNSYMDSLTTDILEKENELFKDPDNADEYPWARSYTQGQVNIYKSAKDAYGSLRQDLTNYLTPGSTPESFANDFSQGGWNGWLALTQRPENNPLGFNIVATENLNKQKNNAVETARAEIQRGNGVLDQKKCVEYEKITFSGARTCNGGIPEDELMPGTTCIPDKPNKTPTNNAPRCIKYETVTPGSVIKSKIDTYINSPERQIELANTINSALNALFAALITKFEDQGLSSLGSKVNNFSSPTISGGFGSNRLFDSLGNPISSTNIFNNTSNDASVNQSFDITRDLGNKYVEALNSGSWDADTNTPEIIPGKGIKHQYYTVSKAGDTKLFPGTHHFTVGEKVYFDGTLWKVGVPKYIIGTKGVFQIQKDYGASIAKAETILPQVIPALGELDYCIPGPNQNWMMTSTDAKDAYSDYLSGVTTEYIRDVYDECPFIGCDGIQFIGGLLNGGLDHSYNVISLPDETEYKDLFDDARNLWDKIVQEEFFWIARNDIHMRYTFSSDHWAVDPAYVDRQVAKWTELSKNAWAEYITKAKALYGIGSPMQSEFTFNGDYNTSYLPMAQAGLDLAKDIVTNASDIKEAIETNETNIAQSSATVYKLTTIKDKVNKIILAAQKRRKDKRDADGLGAIPQICLDNEQVTYIENGVLKR